jgi:hypothetical protein
MSEVAMRWALSVLALATVSAASQSTVPEGPALAQALLGVWCNSDDGGKTCWGYDEFLPGGVITACGRVEERVFSAAATYEIRGRFACFVVTESSDSFGLKPGHRFCSEMLHIDKDTQRHRDVESGEVTTLYRRPASSKRCPGLAADAQPFVAPDGPPTAAPGAVRG